MTAAVYEAPLLVHHKHEEWEFFYNAAALYNAAS